MIGFVDVETTGLSTEDMLLEIAVVITDDDLNELDVFEAIRRPQGWDWLDRIVQQQVVLEMHSANGLIVDLIGAAPRALTQLDARLSSWLGSNHGSQSLTEMRSLVLGGSSVSFDRRVMERCLPQSAAWFHYRQIDVTSITELCRRWWPELAEQIDGMPKPHRALADARRSIDLLHRYRHAGFLLPATERQAVVSA